jgi:pyridinium-3,5-bisthiocarboxylic acid mononucleotide nickel chelatase
MKTLYLECKMGCAGDMLMSALSELVDQNEFISKMNSLGLEGIEFKAIPSSKCGILGTHIQVLIHGQEEHSHDVNEAVFTFHIENIEDHLVAHILDHIEEIEGISNVKYENHNLSYCFDHDYGDVAESKIRNIFANHYPDAKIENQGHTHHEEHHCHGMHMDDIHKVLQNLPVSDRVKKDAEEVYKIIATAESKAHGMDVSQIHFHEVGTMDAIADVVGNCVLFEMIDADRIICSAVSLGNGMVKCAHGILPVPTPATAYILQGIPTYSGNMNGELCTPTGAAILKYFVDSFDVQPTMKCEKIGYGMGNKDFPATNCVRAFLGEMDDDGEVCELECNLDDITPENLGYVLDLLFDNHALDVYVTPVHMKKNRPGYVFTCMCKVSDKEKMMKLMFKHLTTLGIRESTCRRHALNRTIETLHTTYGDVCIKKSSGYGVTREKLEYRDLAKIANENDLSIEEVRKEIECQIQND